MTKALLFGASTIMCGSMLAGTIEAPGEFLVPSPLQKPRWKAIWAKFSGLFVSEHFPIDSCSRFSAFPLSAFQCAPSQHASALRVALPAAAAAAFPKIAGTRNDPQNVLLDKHF